MTALTRKLRTKVGAVLLLVGSAGMIAAPAGASTNPNGAPTVINQWGGTAKVTPGETLCLTSLSYDPLSGYLNHPMSVNEYTPRVYGMPANAGAPTQYVTFRSRLVDLNTGQISYGPWAPWAIATSTTPATWTGSTAWSSNSNNSFINVTHQYRGQQEVLWYMGGNYVGGATLQPVYDHNLAYYNGSFVSDVWQTACKDFMA